MRVGWRYSVECPGRQEKKKRRAAFFLAQHTHVQQPFPLLFVLGGAGLAPSWWGRWAFSRFGREGGLASFPSNHRSFALFCTERTTTHTQGKGRQQGQKGALRVVRKDGQAHHPPGQAPSSRGIATFAWAMRRKEERKGKLFPLTHSRAEEEKQQGCPPPPPFPPSPIAQTSKRNFSFFFSLVPITYHGCPATVPSSPPPPPPPSPPLSFSSKAFRQSCASAIKAGTAVSVRSTRGPSVTCCWGGWVGG